MTTMRLRFSIYTAIVSLVSVVACESNPVRPAPIRVAGRTFNVIALDGKTLPVDVLQRGRASCFTAPVSRALVAFRADGSFLFSYWLVPNDPSAGIAFGTSWTQDATGTVIVSDGIFGTSGTLHGDTLLMQMNALSPFCLPYAFTAVVDP